MSLTDESEIPAYERKAQNLLCDITSLVVPDSDEVVKTGEQMIVFHAVWSKAALAQKHRILKEMLESVYIDTDRKSIVGVRPWADCVPMFRQTPLVEREGMFVLENAKTSQAGGSHVSNGSDGHGFLYWT